MKHSKQIAFIDIESATLRPYPDAAVDKIITLDVTIVQPDDQRRRHHWQFNPGVKMTPENIECHGITNEMAAGYPRLMIAHAKEIATTIHGCDLAGFNLSNYDVPLLWEELNRVGLELDLDGVAIIDAGTIFKKKEERTLEAAVRFYLDRDHKGPHIGCNDVDETIDVLYEQIRRYSDLAVLSVPELAKFSAFDERVDLAGKIVLGTHGQPIYNFGKCKGIKVVDDPGFANWMLSRDFPEYTKRVLRKILGYEEPQKQSKLL